MKLICPVCEREVDVKEDLTCPVCESDLSLLVRYREASVKHQPAQVRPTFISRFWWIFLVALAVPLVWLAFFRDRQTPVAEAPPIVVTATQSAPGPTSLPTEEPTLEPSPTVAPTVEEDETPVVVTPVVEANINVNCRVGPRRTYAIVGYLMEGSSAVVNAVLTDGTWVLIEHPQSPGRGCWVWSEAVSVIGDLDLVPVILPSQ